MTGKIISVNRKQNNELEDEVKFFNRELSWLKFNQRVIAQSKSNSIPLGERLRFSAIAAENLDEFFMVRVAGLLQLRRSGVKFLQGEKRNLDELLDEIITKSHFLYLEIQKELSNIFLLLQKSNVFITDYDDLDDDDKAWISKHFKKSIEPLIVPTTIDPSHPFPFMPNKGSGLILNLKNKLGKRMRGVIMLSNLTRFIRLPGRNLRYISVEKVVLKFIEDLYPGFKLINGGMFRVIRDSEIEINEEAEDLVSQFETALRARRRGNVISLVISDSMSEDIKSFLSRRMSISENNIITTSGVIGISDVNQIFYDLPKKICFSHYEPRFPQRIQDHNGDCFAAINVKDIIVHHPYESFEVVVQFLRQAAEDPDVLVIRQTLYRTTNDSPIVKALISAAEMGKSVTALIELKARFDEENNIRLARDLERAGVQVVYGLTDLKIHAKMSLIIRKEGSKLVNYAHVGTGNYHPITAKIYTDLSFFTSDATICDDVRQIFNYLTSKAEPRKLKKICISPVNGKENLINSIQEEIQNAKQNRPSGIFIKCNAIVDKSIISALYEASNAGVRVDLVVRGICCLIPGVPGMSENIHVKSIVGRFLEHCRIYIFANGSNWLSSKTKVFISSADIMPRNLYKRVEIYLPIENKTVRKQIVDQVMVANLMDNNNSWKLNSEGEYINESKASNEFSCHNYFMTNPSLSGQGSLAEGLKPDIDIKTKAI